MEEFLDGWGVRKRDGWARGSSGGDDGSGDVFSVELSRVGFVDGDDVTYTIDTRYV